MGKNLYTPVFKDVLGNDVVFTLDAMLSMSESSAVVIGNICEDVVKQLTGAKFSGRAILVEKRRYVPATLGGLRAAVIAGPIFELRTMKERVLC